MNLDEMKKLYESEPDKWVVYARMSQCNWHKTNDFSLEENYYQLIHKRQEIIADNIIANKIQDLTFKYGLDTIEAKYNFFEDYNHNRHYSYLLKPQIKQICDNPDVNALYINNMEDLNELEILGEDTTERMTFDKMFDELEQREFAKFGFEVPEFECKLLKVVGSWIIGYAKNGAQAPIPCMWCSIDGMPNGNILTVGNLTPIKPKQEMKFPTLLINIDSDKLRIVYSNDDLVRAEDNHYRLATKQERDSLYCEGK